MGLEILVGHDLILCICGSSFDPFLILKNKSVNHLGPTQFPNSLFKTLLTFLFNVVSLSNLVKCLSIYILQNIYSASIIY